MTLRSLELLKACNALRDILLSRQEWALKRLRTDQYALGNRAGAHLARKIRQRSQKTRIAYLKERKTDHKIIDSQKIEDEFGDYYEWLYNLGEGPNTFQPTQARIDDLNRSLRRKS